MPPIPDFQSQKTPATTSRFSWRRAFTLPIIAAVCIASCQSPPEISEGSSKRLELYYNRYEWLEANPSFVRYDLPIEELDLSSNHIKVFPPLWRLPNLKVLDLSSCDFVRLPDSFRYMRELVSLNMSDVNYLDTLPGWLLRLPKLETLQVFKHRTMTITAVPPGPGALRHLNIVGGSPIDTLPDNSLHLPNLKSLRLSSLQLKRLPASFKEMTQLDTLALRDNLLTRLPDGIVNMKKLRFLDLSFNEGPFENLALLDSLKDLEHLILLQSGVRRLPEGIFGMKNLKSLVLSHNPIAKLPETLGNLHQLRELILSHCGLKHLPTSISQLQSLEVLNVKNNPIGFPKDICTLDSLQALNLGACNIHEVPAEISLLNKLEYLNLSSNPIQKLPIRPGMLPALQSLDLSDCKQASLDEVFVLENLEELSLKGCDIDTIPKAISSLKNLSHLDLSDNQIRHLSITRAMLPHLQLLFLTGNPLDSLELERIEREFGKYVVVYDKQIP